MTSSIPDKLGEKKAALPEAGDGGSKRRFPLARGFAPTSGTSNICACLRAGRRIDDPAAGPCCIDDAQPAASVMNCASGSMRRLFCSAKRRLIPWLGWRFRSPHHSCGACEMRALNQSHTKGVYS
jgi:hypothetical protein